MSRANVDLFRSSFEALGSGIDIDLSETYAVLVTDGRIRRVEEYRTVEQALEAVGGPVQ